jgi:hypothetical protein
MATRPPDQTTGPTLFDQTTGLDPSPPDRHHKQPDQTTGPSTGPTGPPDHRTAPPPLERGVRAARCATCGAQPGQPCTSATGAEMAALVHQARKPRR